MHLTLRDGFASVTVAVAVAVAVAGALCAVAAAQVASNTIHPGCLYAISVAGEQANPCGDGDVRGISRDAQVRKVADFLGLALKDIAFRGCKGALYSALPASADAGPKFVVTYPSDTADPYLAPVVHELAHVLQMRLSSGLRPLTDKYESKRIELGADFITGVVFSQVLSEMNLGEFQHNLSLIGKFHELDTRAHGSPAQRTAAFRRGVYMKFSDVGDIRRIPDHFQADEYGHVILH